MQSKLQHDFLVGVLGTDGCGALNKAIKRQQDLQEVLVPRTVLSFVTTVQELAYKGPIPGLPNSVIALTKSGGIINGTAYTGKDANPYTMAAHLAILLGVGSDSSLAKNTKNIDLTKLGKAIDLLAKSRLIRKSKHTDDCTVHQDVGCNCGAMAKTDLPGSTAKPIKPDGPQGAAPPEKAPKTNTAVATNKKQKPTVKPPETPDKIPGLKAVPTVKIPDQMKVGKSEMFLPCGVCGQAQFRKDNGFWGCLCFRGLSPFTLIKMEPDHFVITFGPEWSPEAIETLWESMHHEDPLESQS